MTPEEFKDSFWPDLKARMPSVKEWVLKLDGGQLDASGKKVQLAAIAMLRIWRDVLGDVELFDALAVTLDMSAGNLVPIGTSNHDRENLAATIRSHARQRAFERSRSKEKAKPDTKASVIGSGTKLNLMELVGKPPEVIAKAFGGKVRADAHECWTCRDTLKVEVWHPRNLEEIDRGRPVSVATGCQIWCDCSAAKYARKSNHPDPIYDASRHCLIDWRGPLHPSNLENAKLWIEIKQGERLERNQPNIEFAR